MTNDLARAAIANLIAAAREAAEFLARNAEGSAGQKLGENLRLGLAGTAPVLRRLDDADAVGAFCDTLMAVVAVARRTALPVLTGEDRTSLEAALRAADDLLAGWSAPIAESVRGSAEILKFPTRGTDIKAD